MNGISIFRHIPSNIQINPSEVVFTKQPTSQSICLNTGVATFEAVAALSPANNQTGDFSYQWYKDGFLINDGSYAGGTITGTKTNTLTISNLTDDSDWDSKFKVLATFTPTGTTPYPYNNPLFSNTVTLTIIPDISIVTQPEDFSGIIDEPAVFTVEAEQSNPSSGSFSYQWRLDGVNLTDGNIVDTFENSERVTKISGSKTDTLTITSNQPRNSTVSCIVSHSTACNSPIVSDTVDLSIVIPTSVERSILRWEVVKDDQPILLDQGSQNIYQNPLDFSSAVENYRQTIVLWAPERDMEVYITMEGASGSGFNNRSGGSGGKSIFSITLKRNTEYVFRLGPALEPYGGRGGGGGAAFFYEKGQLLAVVGGGGGSGRFSNGGDGGGIGLAGRNGSGGRGGLIVPAGTLDLIGASKNLRFGGRVGSCTLGDYYQSEGISPCVDVGKVQFRIDDGTITPGSAVLQRGYKAGGTQTYRNNGGNSSFTDVSRKGSNTNVQAFVGGGGSGTNGGDATNSRNNSGGGGSGYTNGTVQVLLTQVGQNETPFSKVNIALPFPIAPPITIEDVTFTVSRDASFTNRIIFRLESGEGPATITWGPNPSRRSTVQVVASIQKGSVYVLDRIEPPQGRKLRLRGNTLELEDFRDNDYTDLQITPNKGNFVSTTRYEF